MNKEICRILKDWLLSNGGLPFVEVMAGMVQTVEYKDPMGDEGVMVTKRMPVSTDTNMATNCKLTPERELIPDSMKKGLLYFEDYGAQYIGRGSGERLEYRSNVRLICWMNRARLVGDAYTEITSYCITNVLAKLNLQRPVNSGNFIAIRVEPGRIYPQDKGIFSRYTYDETITQYLRPPFEFFAVDLTVTYFIHPACIGQLQFVDPVCY